MPWKLGPGRQTLAHFKSSPSPQPNAQGAASRGFVKLWQFRPGRGTVAEPDRDHGPYRRDANLARVEAVLFLAREPLNSRRIAELADLADGTQARTLIRRLNHLFDDGGAALLVEELAGGYQLLTRPVFAPWLKRITDAPIEARLSAPAMETLAVVAYRQPILRAEIESIRGVGCEDILRQLLDRDLVRIVGRSEDLGRPLLYGTTKRFLEVYGLRSLNELPRAAELKRTPELLEAPIH
jgi:segregation and condensation protein B